MVAEKRGNLPWLSRDVPRNRRFTSYSSSSFNQSKNAFFKYVLLLSFINLTCRTHIKHTITIEWMVRRVQKIGVTFFLTTFSWDAVNKADSSHQPNPSYCTLLSIWRAKWRWRWILQQSKLSLVVFPYLPQYLKLNSHSSPCKYKNNTTTQNKYIRPSISASYYILRTTALYLGLLNSLRQIRIRTIAGVPNSRKR